ncbi:MAG TPA: carboxypeptidase-like regulatory domain-containing protein [Solirubrobacterales bacterium]
MSTQRGPRQRKLRLGAVLVAVCISALLAIPSVAFADTGSISGRVTNGGFGRELNPLPEVFVCALQSEEEEEVQGQNCELTNSNGEYTIPNLPFGDYKIEFWPRAYVRWVFEYYDDTRHWSQAQWIDVNGPVAGIDSDLTIGGEFIGHVTRASDGEPLSEVLICAEEPLQEFTECTESWGDQGVYQLASLIEGDYLVEFLPAEGQGVRAQFYNGKSESSEADLVHVTAEAQTTEIDAALPAEATITGLVTDASTRSGLGEIEVCAFELAGSEITDCEFTEPSGSYVITDLPTGAYKVGFFSESESEEEEEEEEEELPGPNPFPVEFWNDQPSWETANILTFGLGVRGGIDAALGSPPSAPATAQASTFPSSTFPSVPKPKTRRARCPSGKRWKKVKGKKRCVKVHKPAHRKRPRRQ